MPTSIYDFPDGFAGGMNISLSPDKINPSSSPDMENICYNDGSIPTKRFGFNRVNATSWGTTPIQGTFEFYMIGVSAPIFLVAHGGKIYSYDEATDTKTDLCTGTVLTVTDSPTSFFQVRDKCFIQTGTEFVYYDGINPIATVASIAKVPTITLGRKTTGGGTPNEKLNHLSNSWIDSFDPDGIATTFPLSFSGLSATLVTAILNGVDKTETVDFTVDRTTGIVTWGSAPPVGTDTLTIQAEKSNLMDATVITKCDKSIEYGGKNNSIVFISGNPSYPNVARYCWFYDPAYWPEDSDISVGNDARFISGWGRMNDYLVIYKQPGDEFVQWYSELELDATGTVSVATNGLNDEFGCIAPKTVHPAQNGLLALSDKGVIWTWTSLIKGQANCKIVSQGVNGKNGIAKGILDNTQADLAIAHAEISGNKYLLHIKDKVWVLDLDYSDLANNVYCWYPYTGLYAKAGTFLMRSGNLYMSENVNGLLYKEQQAGDDTEHADDGVAIDAWWASPLMFLGGREWIKKFERINLTFKAGHGTNHTLYLMSDTGVEEVVLRQEAGTFDARYFNAEFFNAGSLAPNYPNSQSEKIGVKAEYMSFKIRNNMLNRGVTLLSTMITFSLRKLVK